VETTHQAGQEASHEPPDLERVERRPEQRLLTADVEPLGASRYIGALFL